MEVNISADLRGEVENKLGIETPEDSRKKVGSQASTSMTDVIMGGEQENVPLDVFDEAQAAVFKLMESDSLPRFKNGKIFRGYVDAMTADKRGDPGKEQLQDNKVKGGPTATPPGKGLSSNPHHNAGIALAKSNFSAKRGSSTRGSNGPTGPQRRTVGRAGMGRGGGGRGGVGKRQTALREKKLSDDDNNLLANIVSDNQL